MLGWAAALRLRDPHVPGSWGSCPFLAVTGLPCPVCGGLRAVADLTRGDVVAAVGSNAYVVLLLPVLAAWWALWLRRTTQPAGPGTGWTADVPLPRPTTVALAVAVLVLFGVLRWLPFAAALAP